jgi:type II secretory pathway pseudopilin PulG
VIAIIALLMAILMPALQRVKKQARSVMCQANLKQWGTLFALYTDDNNGQFPERKSGSDAYGRWMDSMRDYYITTEDIRCCPVAKKIANPDMIDGIDWWGDTFTSWGKVPPWDSGGQRTIGYYGSYGVNGYIYVPIGAYVYDPSVTPEKFWRTPHVKGNSDIPMLLDCYFWCGWPLSTNTPPEFDGHQMRTDANAMNRYFLNRHDGHTTAVFLDYHVQKVGIKELFTLNWHRGFNRKNIWTKAGGVRAEDWANYGNGWLAQFKDY